MGLEVATFISDLVTTNPTATDLKTQGDDHLRALKTAVKGSFPGSSKAWYNPTSSVKTIDFTIAASGMNTTYLVDTTAGTVTATLPTLVSGDAGWECFFIKTNAGTSPLFIAPASGTLQSGDLAALAKTRRTIPGVRCSAFWTGTAWIVSRAVTSPVGSVIDFDGSSLPVGFEWPNGQTLSGASGSVYPDYFARKASLAVVDLRGRVGVGKDDMGGSAASRVTTAGSGVDGATLDAVGGAQNQSVLQANLPNISFAVAIPSGQGSHTHVLDNADNVVRFGGASTVGSGAVGVTLSTVSTEPATLPAMTGTAASGGVGTALTVMQPSVVLNKILVVE